MVTARLQIPKDYTYNIQSYIYTSDEKVCIMDSDCEKFIHHLSSFNDCVSNSEET